MIVIKTAARINAAQAPELEDQMKAALASGDDEIEVNMEDTTYLSSVGLRVFASAQKKVNASGKTMVFTHVQRQILEIFEVTGFVGVLTIE